VVGEAVHLVPGDLLGEEVPDPGCRQHLREAGGVPEHVGQPEVVGVDAELVAEEAPAVDDLADQRLAGGDVAVGLDPHAADHLEAPLGHPLADALPDRRVAVAHPRQLLRLGDGEAEVGVAVHRGEGGRERAGALADGLPQRPEPGRVDVGVADRA
jgi:hypothetical protein